MYYLLIYFYIDLKYKNRIISSEKTITNVINSITIVPYLTSAYKKTSFSIMKKEANCLLNRIKN